jgi:hypothetical protein
MSNGSPASGYLYLVSSEGVTSMLNRQQLLGSMPKMLDALAPDQTIVVEPIDQTLFTKALTMLRERAD